MIIGGIIGGRVPAQGRCAIGACRLGVVDLTMGPLLDVESERNEYIAADRDHNPNRRIRRAFAFAFAQRHPGLGQIRAQSKAFTINSSPVTTTQRPCPPCDRNLGP